MARGPVAPLLSAPQRRADGGRGVGQRLSGTSDKDAMAAMRRQLAGRYRGLRSMRVTGYFYRSVAVIVCFFMPLLAVIDGAAHVAHAQQADLQNGLAEIAAKHGLNQVWF